MNRDTSLEPTNIAAHTAYVRTRTVNNNDKSAILSFLWFTVSRPSVVLHVVPISAITGVLQSTPISQSNRQSFSPENQLVYFEVHQVQSPKNQQIMIKTR